MHRILFVLLILCCFSLVDPAKAHDANSSSFPDLDLIDSMLVTNETQGFSHRILVAHFKWDSVHTVYIFALWLLLAGIAKLVFNRAKGLTYIFPESSLLIVIGLAIGYLLKNFHVDHDSFRLESHAFFIYLLPPIIFDAGYFMPNRAFFRNWDSIMLFAIVGTVFNTLTIGGALLVFEYLNIFTIRFTTFEILLFSALISAVDPVAVIAVFEDIHVNDFIFVNVFGEALFNDGVTVVLYELFKQFLELGDNEILPIDYAAGAGSFFVVALGGVFVGLVAAIVVALLTKYSDHVRVLIPLFIFLVPYMGYLTAEALSLSPILAIAVCGMAMKQYVKGNMTATAANSVKYFTKMLAQSSETVIFMFLGLSTLSFDALHWDFYFIALTVVFCIVFRTIGVILQCAFLNKFRGKKFTMMDQFILSYGGLRGAIAFGLASSMPDSIQAKPMFLTTTIVVIYFTVFLQGSTIRPLVNLLKIEKKSQDEPTMAESVYGKYLDYMISGVEDIAGQKGHLSLVHDFERFNNKVLCPVLMRHHAKTKHFDATKIVRAYAKIILRDAIGATTLPPHKRLTALQMDDGYGHARATTIGFTGNGYTDHANRAALSGRCNCNTIANLQPGQHSPDCHLYRPDMDALYTIFSEMLDKKLDEMQTQSVKGFDNTIGLVHYGWQFDYVGQTTTRSGRRCG